MKKLNLNNVNNLLSREQMRKVIGGYDGYGTPVCAFICNGSYHTIQCYGGCTYNSDGSAVTCGDGSRAGCFS